MRTTLALLTGALALCANAATTHAQHAHSDWAIASTADGSGNLAVEYDFATQVGLDFDETLTNLLPPGNTAYSSTDPGFDSIEASEPDEDLYRLPSGTAVSVTFTRLSPGVSIFFPHTATLIDAAGQSVSLGVQDAPPPGDLHQHGEMRLILVAEPDEPGEGSFSFVVTAPGFGDSEEYTVTLSNAHLFVDYADATNSTEVKANLTCQKAIGKAQAKLAGGYMKTLVRCLDAVAEIVANEEAGLDTAAAEARAAKSCGDDGGSLPAQATLLGKLGTVVTKAASSIQVKCGTRFDQDQVLRHLNQAACNVQKIGAQGYPEAHVVLEEITSGGEPVADALGCLFPTQGSHGED